jgi:D-serine deaminase-like pyridoxal phosphate-dependent protein
MKIVKPTLLVDEQKARKNIQTILRKAQTNGAELRPHFKTHQSADVGEWFKSEGITKATVSSVDMARYFANAGWEDITIAFPYNPLEAEAIEELAKKIKLHVTIVSKAALNHLNHHVDSPISYFIKVDVGTNRTGILPALKDEIQDMGQSLNPNHDLVGLLAHAGHTYQPMTKASATRVFQQSMKDLKP